MKTWIAENQLLAIIILALIVVGAVYLFKYLSKKYGSKDKPAPSNPDVININDAGSSAGTGRMASKMGMGGTAHGAAPSGARTSSGGRTH